MSVGKIVPICAETAHLLPEDLQAHPHAAISIYERLSMEPYTRVDDAKRESLAGRYLPGLAQVLMEAPATKQVKNKKTGEMEDVAVEAGVATQMRYGFETISAGTVFACAITLRHVTPLEFESFMVALRAWSVEPIIGGKSSIGMGQVKLEFPGWAVANPLLRRDGETEVGQPFGTLYRDHIQDQRHAILQLLEAIG